MKRLTKIAALSFLGLAATMVSCGNKESKLHISFTDDYEGEDVELISYEDSIVFDKGVVRDGHVEFVVPVKESLLAQVVIDGKVKGFFITESGEISLCDSVGVATGTPLNDKFYRYMEQLDSVADYDNDEMYVAFAEKVYNENKENPISSYFGAEWCKYSELNAIDSLLVDAPEHFKNSKRVAKSVSAAKLREATSPGHRYTDFQAKQPSGEIKKLSDYIASDSYTLVDFWASWCPYCIKEMPALADIYKQYHQQGFNIVSVAVRDKAEDTEAAVRKHKMVWDIMYNAERVPYDIYGFTGIPHLMLIDGNGMIVSRGETPKQIAERLEKVYSSK
jgi:thiol-disulfide isomerase/thioredoxin